MRVIAGRYKRQNLETLVGHDTTRPTADRVKEALFNIIQDEVVDSLCLDLFAGSGALGIEALSQGARRVTFVENNNDAFVCIQKNLKKLKISESSAMCVREQVEDFLISPLAIPKNQPEERYSLVFADPPYQSTWYQTALESLHQSSKLQDQCLLVLESNEKLAELKHHIHWELQDIRTYRRTKLWFYRYHQTAWETSK